MPNNIKPSASPIQKREFTTGGFVLHKVTVDGYEGRFSAWYDKEGNLLDAQQIFPSGKTRDFLRFAPDLRASLQTIGQRYFTPQKAESTIQSCAFRLPASWASYLVNGDDSGLSSSEVVLCNAWLDQVKPGSCVSCDQSEEFSRSHDAWDFFPYSGATELFTFHKASQKEGGAT